MKKIVCLIALCLAAISLQAQGNMSYSLELVAGAGVGKGPQFIVTPEFVAQYQWDGGFRTGLGAGIRYARPIVSYTVKNGKHTHSTFSNEVDIPVFLRFGYGKGKLFANLDAGYAIDILSFYDSDWYPGGKKDPTYNGLFLENQLGWKFGRHSALALGLLLQQNIVTDRTIVEIGTIDSPDYKLSEASVGHKQLTPAITLRYVLLF
ncbi:MAG: hypothetical protein II851_00800 [Bacteroidales bacterium]|nr:hypothetical protein [Bacteroidales bacterium]